MADVDVKWASFRADSLRAIADLDAETQRAVADANEANKVSYASREVGRVFCMPLGSEELEARRREAFRALARDLEAIAEAMDTRSATETRSRL